MANPIFGRVFTDHMVTIRYADGKGWYDARVEARAPIPMDPATAVLHYAQEIFEGLKAYRTGDGGVTLFRPDANAKRFRDSAARMAMAAWYNAVLLGVALAHVASVLFRSRDRSSTRRPGRGSAAVGHVGCGVVVLGIRTQL